MWFLLSICAILAWSGSDLFSKIGSKPTDKYSHWKLVMAVGLVMGIHAIVQLCSGVEFSFNDIIVYLPVSALYILSMILGYVGLRYIELSISSPICNSSGAVVVLLCYFVLKESIGGWQLLAVILICTGVIGLAVVEKRQSDAIRAARREAANVKYTSSVLAIIFPILYCLLDALGTFADAYWLEMFIEETQANMAYEFTFLAMAVFGFIYVVVIKKQKIIVAQEKAKIAAGVCETAGQFAYIFAIGANAILAAPAISSYCVFSVLWSRIFLKEKLSRAHYIVISLVLVGIVILGVFDV